MMDSLIQPINRLDLPHINEAFRRIQLTLSEIKAAAESAVSYVGPYVSGTVYPKGTLMADDGWLVVANKDTLEYPFPQPTGTPEWVVYGDNPPALPQASYLGTSTARGHEYTFTAPGYVLAQRWYSATDNGQQAKLIFELTTPGSPINASVIADVIQTETGWFTQPVGAQVVGAGTVVSHYARYKDDGNSVDTPANYNYITPQQDRVSLSGEIIQSDRTLDTLHVNKTDADGGSQGTTLDGLVIGDEIAGASVTWSIADVISSDTNEVVYQVSPQSQEAVDGIQPFVLRKFGITTLYYGHEPNYLDQFPNIRSFFELEGGVREFGEGGRGWDLQVQPAIMPEDWDILQAP